MLGIVLIEDPMGCWTPKVQMCTRREPPLEPLFSVSLHKIVFIISSLVPFVPEFRSSLDAKFTEMQKLKSKFGSHLVKSVCSK